ncbi:MAG: hypothetical protein JW864_13865 [Spirochaetes bacterium]|nr:hypothetical protein [Spirochaetota bacterium]
MKRVLIFLSICALSALLASCNSLNDQETAMVTIDTGIRASKAAAPSDITDISVTVSGEGMATMTRSIPTDTGIRTFEVPVGSARFFSVKANGQYFTYIGSATYDIFDTEENNINISMIKQAGVLNLNIPNQSSYTGTVESFTIAVTMSESGSTIEQIFSPSDALLMDVPSGNSREITITTTPLSISAAVSFSTEEAVADFISGEETNVSVSPVVTETKILIPDFLNGRIVQINNGDFNDPLWSPDWIEKDASSSADGLYLSTISINSLYPYDIAIDSSGRIYIANNYSLPDGAIIRIDNINDTSPESITAAAGIQSLALDRVNNLLYFSTSGSSVFRIRTDVADTATDLGFDDTELADGNYNITGLEVDNNYLYLSNNMGATIKKVDLNLSYPDRVLSQYSGSFIAAPFDIIIKSNYVYYTDLTGHYVVQTNTDLVEQDVLLYAPGESDSFNDYGPNRFLAVLNSRFYLIDEDTSGTVNRLVSFPDFTSDWSEYSGDSNFRFYAC